MSVILRHEDLQDHPRALLPLRHRRRCLGRAVLLDPSDHGRPNRGRARPPKSVGGGGDPKPGSVVRSAKALKLDKSTNVIPDLDKEARSRDLTAKEALESKFRNWRDDGRRQFEEIFQGDRERTGLVMRALFQKEEFRGMFQQSRELEAKWPKATDDEKAAIMAQMESIRTQGLAMVSMGLEERRVGKECLRLCRSRWSPYH